MNILVIPTWYPNGTDKLMGIYHKEYCKALSKIDNIHIDMLYIDRQRLNAPIKYLTMQKQEIIKEDGYKVYIKKILNIHKISESLEMKKYVYALEKLYLEYIKNNKKPDILHAEVMIPAGYAACVIGKKYNIPVVITEHASYFKRFFEGKNKKYSDLCISYAHLTSVSKYMAKEISKYKACDVIPNLVDTDSFKIKKEKVNGLQLVTTSALRQGKRVDDIIKALKILIEKHHLTDAELTIIGDGFLEDYYKEKCHELNMDNYVKFVGRKTKKEISEIYKSKNIYVNASELETFYIPGIEALASGLPIVSTKCLGPEEYITKECGELVPIKSPEKLADAIWKVYNNLDKYDPKELQKVAIKYGSQEVSQIAIKKYKECLK